MESFCANSPRSFPSIQENLRPFSLTSPLNFMQFHAPLDKVQSCFAVKETAFQFGCSNFPAGRTRSYTSMGWSVAFSIARNHSKRLREHGVCQNPAFSLVSPLPNRGAQPTICTSHPCRPLTAPPPPSFLLVGMMPPTCTNIRVRTARDAELIFHAVRLGILPMVMQRLGSEERMALCTGCVYVWEERSGSLSESMEQGIERFTEGRSWGPSRYRTLNDLCHNAQLTVCVYYDDDVLLLRARDVS